MLSPLADQYSWLQYGIEKGWVTNIFCVTHDGPPYTEEDAEFEEEYDEPPCMPCVRIIEQEEDDDHPSIMDLPRIFRLNETDDATTFAWKSVVNPNAPSVKPGLTPNTSDKLKKAKKVVGCTACTGDQLKNAVLQWQKNYNKFGRGAGRIVEDGLLGNQTYTAMGIQSSR
jgi:hypothetical protein